MAGLKEGLKPLKSESPKPLPKSNAEKCREYRQRRKADPISYIEWKEKKKYENRRARNKPLTEEEIILKREKHRLYMREQRAKQISQSPKTKHFKSKSEVMSKTKSKMTRIQPSVDAARRENNRLRQAFRRANLSAQKKSNINEKRREQYSKKKAATSETTAKNLDYVFPLYLFANVKIEAVRLEEQLCQKPTGQDGHILHGCQTTASPLPIGIIKTEIT